MGQTFYTLSQSGVSERSLHFVWITSKNRGRGGCLVISVLAFKSGDPSSIPAEVYNFSVKSLLKRTKISIKTSKNKKKISNFYSSPSPAIVAL